MAYALDSNISAERIRHLFDYEPSTGYFIRRVNAGRGLIGTIIQSKTLQVDGEWHKLCRYIWLHYYGEWPLLNIDIDHIDRNSWNNIISNLRLATRTQNQQNKITNNPNGKGVTWRDRQSNPWLSKIRVNGKRINLGSFATKEEAAEAYKVACLKYHGEFACLE